MRALLAYGGAAAAILVVLAGLVIGLIESAEAVGVWVAAAIAWPVQVLAFWALTAGRRASGKGLGSGFMMGWAAGMALRFGAVGLVAAWLTLTGSFDAATVLVSLVGFVFVLVLLEPLFLRLAD